MSLDNLALLYTAQISHRFRRLKGLNIRLWTTALSTRRYVGSNAAGCILVPTVHSAQYSLQAFKKVIDNN